jgi:hypothetical protein
MALAELEDYLKNPWGDRPVYPYSEEFKPKYHPDWPGFFSIGFILEHPEYFERFPGLLEALEAVDNRKSRPMLLRREMAPYTQIPLPFLREVRDRVNANGDDLIVVPHPPCLTAAEHEAEIAKYMDELTAQFGILQMPRVIKTVTLKFSEEGIVLVCGGGDFRIEKSDKRSIAGALGYSSAKYTTINPESFDPRRIGFIPGMVKPMPSARGMHDIDAVCYLHQDPMSRVSHFALTGSPFESIIFPVPVFEEVFPWYLKAYYPGITCERAQGMDIFKNPRPASA